MKSLTSVAIASALALPAFAGEHASVPISYQSAEPEWSWTGFYFGVQVGGAFNTGDNGDLEFDGGPGTAGPDGNFDEVIPAFGNNFDGSFDSSFTGGLFAGYDRQFGRFILGGVVDANFADIRQRQSGFSNTPAFYHEDREIDFMATGRLRFGYAFNDRVMAYLTGGLAYAHVDYDFKSNTGATVVSRGGDSSQFGYVVGLGVEARVTRNISLGLEYLYTNLGDDNYKTNLSGVGAFAPSTDTRGSDRDFDYHMIQAKLAYRF